MNRMLAFVGAMGIAGLIAAAALASAPPVGRLTALKTTFVKTTPDRMVVVTLPRPAIKGGVWRIARAFDAEVVQQLGERTLATGGVRITLQATGPGTTRVVFALTKGETARAYAARAWQITVGDKPAPTG